MEWFALPERHQASSHALSLSEIIDFRLYADTFICKALHICIYIAAVFSMNTLREQVKTEDAGVKKKQFESGPKASHGYGGQFGVENEKMDKVDSRN